MSMLRIRTRMLAGAVCCVVATMLGTFLTAPAASATVDAIPASWTPQITSSNAIVRQLVQCGSTMYAAGIFSTVSQGGVSYTRNNAFSFDATTGALTAWNPAPNGEVNSVALSADCATAYLGGKFTQVGPTPVKNIAAVSTLTGQVIGTFAHQASGTVNTIVLANSGLDLLVGGNFSGINGTGPAFYASLDPTTGTPNSYLQVSVSGQYPPNSGGTKVYNQQVSASGTRLLFEGIFTSVSGQLRQQIAELDLSSTAATLDVFSNSTMNTTNCRKTAQFYVRDAAFSPDEQTVYIATTGHSGTSPYCDAAVAFTNTANASVKWINKTGGDSLYSVAASDADVYIGGHERWANNPHGNDSCGTGCVSRPGIGDIGAIDGLATSWNPTRDRGLGADDLVLTGAGLWVASDTYYGSVLCAGQYHPGICFFPGA